MARVHISLLLCFALFAVQDDWLQRSAGPQPMTAVSGVYSVTFHLNIASKLPRGAQSPARRGLRLIRQG